ncbi:MAG: D-alanyl-D-alanine carboxypeptidase [Firmicutes bacterium]|nr:D-alanyl-D-alanine carboxypeptidase [Bacillota bacterium]
MKKFVVFMLVIFMSFPAFIKADNLTLAPNSKSAIMLEVSTGEILFEKNSHERLHPASMTKMMSLLLIMESIEKNIIKLDDMVTVSSNASGMGGSQILLETNEQMSVDDLIKGVTIASGNDAVVALAERIAGTEEEFVNMMNNKVKELGLNDTNFKNSHGLDAANHYSSAYDMSIIAKELVKHEKILEYSRIYEMYLRENTDRKIWLVNTNKLVRFYNGVDGLKTGYTKEAGYCLTATAKKNDMRIITVVMGEPDSSTRNSEVTGMLDYAFSQYEIEKLLSKESIIGETLVEKGTNKYVKLVPTSDVTVLNKKINGKKNATYEVEVDNIIAPVTKGSIVGKLHIKEDDNLTRTIDITVSEDVKKANLFELYLRYLKEILIGDVGI